MVTSRGEAGSDQDRPEFIAVQMGDVGRVVDTRSSDVHRRGMLDDALLFGVAIEPNDRAQPARHRGSCLAAILEVASEALDVDAADVEQPMIALPTPGAELAQIQGV